MDSESYRVKNAIDEVCIDISSQYKELITYQETRSIVKEELNKLGGELAMGSALLWVNYTKKDLIRNVLKTLHVHS